MLGGLGGGGAVVSPGSDPRAQSGSIGGAQVSPGSDPSMVACSSYMACTLGNPCDVGIWGVVWRCRGVFRQ